MRSSGPRSTRSPPSRRAPTFENTVVALERSGGTLDRVSSVFFALVSSLQHAGHPRDRGRGGAAARRPLRRDRARRRPVRAHRRAASRSATTSASTRSRCGCWSATTATSSGRAPGSTPPNRRGCGRSTPSSRRCRPSSAARCSPRATSRRCTSPTWRGSTGWPRTRSRRRPRAAQDRGLDGIPAHARAADRQPALAVLADRGLREELHSASIARGLARQRARHPRDGPADRQRCGPSGRGCSATRTTRPGPSRSAPPAPSRRSTPCWASSRRSRRPTPSRRSRSSASTPATRCRPGTARSTPSRCAASGSRSTPTRCARTSSWSGCCTTASSTRRGLLYGLRFAERSDLPRYHPDVRIFDVHDEHGQLGLFIADFYARESKRGGAWMNSFVAQSHLLGTRPVVAQHPQHPATGRRASRPC